jgi:hypothetical protein
VMRAIDGLHGVFGRRVTVIVESYPLGLEEGCSLSGHRGEGGSVAMAGGQTPQPGGRYARLHPIEVSPAPGKENVEPQSTERASTPMSASSTQGVPPPLLLFSPIGMEC